MILKLHLSLQRLIHVDQGKSYPGHQYRSNQRAAEEAASTFIRQDFQLQVQFQNSQVSNRPNYHTEKVSKRILRSLDPGILIYYDNVTSARKAIEMYS